VDSATITATTATTTEIVNSAFSSSIRSPTIKERWGKWMQQQLQLKMWIHHLHHL
jgi:hypothetical protein